MTDEIRALTLERASATAITDMALSQGMVRMREDGLEKIAQGLTTVSEVVRVTGSN